MNSPLFDSYREIIPDFEGFQESLYRPFPVHLRINSLKVEPQILLKSLQKKGILLRKTSSRYDTLYEAEGIRSPGKLVEYFMGHIHPQAFTSCLASLALSPGSGSYVLDMCASPGGKSTHLAQIMNNSGLVIANELYTNRHIPFAHTINRMGILNCVLTAYQAQEFPLGQRFDFIMADVPCSGEGRIRLSSRYREKWYEAKRPKLLTVQKKIILRGFDLLKEEGVLLYSTCTYDPEENESVIEYLLENRDAEILPIDMGIPSEPGIGEWKGKTYDREMGKTARFYPHQSNSVGFFMARIGKK